MSTKVCPIKAIGFPLAMYGCESWTIKKAEYQRIDALELWCWRRLFENPLDCKEIKPVNAKGNQYWLFTGRTDAEAETPVFQPPDAQNWFIGKDPDAGKDWRQEEKGMTEDEMVGWHHWLNGHEFEQAPGVGDGQGNLSLRSQRVRHDWATELNSRTSFLSLNPLPSPALGPQTLPLTCYGTSGKNLISLKHFLFPHL